MAAPSYAFPASHFTTRSGQRVALRAAALADTPAMGLLAARAFGEGQLSAYLSPARHAYWGDFVAGFVRRVRARFVSPRNVSVVAVAPAAAGEGAAGGAGQQQQQQQQRRRRRRQPEERIVGYVQCVRLGEDAGARARVAAAHTRDPALRLRGWLVWLADLLAVWARAARFGRADRSEGDGAAAAHFRAEEAAQAARFWGAAAAGGGDAAAAAAARRERWGSRWHVQSLVVDAAWQGKGVGRRLMAGVLAEAAAERVPVGLEASLEGRRLYEKLGFVLRGAFELKLGEAEEGGVMAWVPEGWVWEDGERLR